LGAHRRQQRGADMRSSNTAKEKEPKKVAAVHPAVKSVAGAALLG